MVSLVIAGCGSVAAETNVDAVATPVAPVIKDIDGDGVPDKDDIAPNDPSVATKADLDADGDGVPDEDDAFPQDPDRWEPDQDDDGVPNAEDAFPADPERWEPDRDSDGVPDSDDDYPRDPDRSSRSDRDGDGVPNTKDVAPRDPTRSAWDSGIVTDVVDGDTIRVQGFGTIRLIGIDTPEAGDCGFDRASQVMRDLVLGQTVSLIPGARDDRDRYDRLLRYIDVGNVDAGLQVIKRGLAIARYDSRDGYGAHTREQRYITADTNSPDRTGEFCPAPPPPPPAPTTPEAPAQGTEPWNLPGPDLDCADIGHRVIITGQDYHRLDADGDGIGCDSYG